MSLSILHSIATVIAMVAFFGICWWAYSPKNRQRFEDDASIVLRSDPPQNPKPNAPDIESREKP